MPAYNNAYPPNSISYGEQQTLVNNETLGAGVNSQRVAIQDKDTGVARPITVTFTYPVAPAAVQYDIYVAWDDVLTSYTKVGSTTNTAGDQVTIQRAATGGINFRFLLVKEVITPSQLATVVARQ